MIKIITYVLDDDYDELLLLKPHLEKVCGCDLLLFTDAEMFIAAIERGTHIGIIDHQLNARIDGIEVGRKVLQQNPLLFLILFSGSPNPKVWQNATNSGFRGLVDKNDQDSYEQVAHMVERQMPLIKARIEEYESLEKLNSKYSKYLTNDSGKISCPA
jgi:DNA-binding NtrC family response regulator